MVKQVKPLEPIEHKPLEKGKRIIKQVTPLVHVEVKPLEHVEAKPIKKIIPKIPKKWEGRKMKITDVLIVIGSTLFAFTMFTVITFFQQFFVMLEYYGTPPEGYIASMFEVLWKTTGAPFIVSIIFIGLGFLIQYVRTRS